MRTSVTALTKALVLVLVLQAGVLPMLHTHQGDVVHHVCLSCAHGRTEVTVVQKTCSCPDPIHDDDAKRSTHLCLACGLSLPGLAPQHAETIELPSQRACSFEAAGERSSDAFPRHARPRAPPALA